MNRQEIFNTAYLGLASQGFVRSVDRQGERCFYRKRDGDRMLKCAIGHFIPDDKYHANMEAYGPYAVLIRTGLIETDAANWEDNEKFLKHLQSAHDSALSPEIMQIALVRFAEGYGLTVPTVMAGQL